MLRCLVALVFLAGCASSGGVGKPLHQFPSKQELAEHEVALRTPLAAKVVELEGWKLELPALDPHSPVHTLFPVLAPGATASPALDCAAHEIGRILLHAPDKRPSSSALRFISARCGAVVVAPAFQSWVGAADDSTDEAWVERLKPSFQKSPSIHAARVGAALVREGDKRVLVVSFANPEATIESSNVLIGSEPSFRVAGRVAFDAVGVAAVVNSGSTSVASCALDPGVALPDFRAICPVAAEDDSAWVQISAVPRGHVLSKHVFQTIVLRRPDAATVYRPERAREPLPVTDAGSFANAVLRSLNGLRQQIGLRPLKLAQAQSQFASKLTPSLFMALERSLTSSDASGDLLSLGLMAGWDVNGGTIRDCGFGVNLTIDSLDAARWLTDMLEVPTGRALLLDPEVHELALGAVVQRQPAAIAGVALTYSFFEPESTPGAWSKRLIDRLALIRNARHLGATEVIPETPELRAQLSGVQRGQVAPQDALQSLMKQMSYTQHTNVQGLIWDTQDLDAIEFPDALLRAGDVKLAAGVTYYRAPHAAWGQYCVVFVVLDKAPQLQASRVDRTTAVRF